MTYECEQRLVGDSQLNKFYRRCAYVIDPDIYYEAKFLTEMIYEAENKARKYRQELGSNGHKPISREEFLTITHLVKPVPEFNYPKDGGKWKNPQFLRGNPRTHQVLVYSNY